MIETCSRFAVENLFTRVMRAPHRFRTVVVASPFIDEFGIELLMNLDHARGTFTLSVLTRPETAAALRTRAWRRTSIRALEGLHAKLYAALGEWSCEHEAVITSANLTEAGLHANIEIGLRVTGSRREYVALVEQVVRWSTSRAAGHTLRPNQRRATDYGRDNEEPTRIR